MTNSPGWKWQTNTAPFSAIDNPAAPAHFVVEQVGDAEFAIPDCCGFQYNPPCIEPIVVDKSSLETTDFASIPPFMSWFVSRYGRHTPAALVHDRLVTGQMSFKDRRAADRRFLEMMDALQVPPVRSRVMWAAVSLATLRGGGLRRFTAMFLWFVGAAAGMVLLVHGLVSRSWFEVAVALLAQLPASVLWGSLWRAGVIAGYALPLVIVPAAVSWLGYAAYSAIELSMKLLLKVGRRKTAITDAPLIKYREM